MKKLKIYLETTIFNFYFATDSDEKRDAALILFDEIKQQKYEVYTSISVIRELEQDLEPKKSKMLNLIEEYNIMVVDDSTNDNVKNLALKYVEEKIIPEKYATDAIHIAVASVYDLDMIISYNFNHIVKEKTRNFTALINATLGYKTIKINSPLEVVEFEEND